MGKKITSEWHKNKQKKRRDSAFYLHSVVQEPHEDKPIIPEQLIIWYGSANYEYVALMIHIKSLHYAATKLTTVWFLHVTK